MLRLALLAAYVAACVNGQAFKSDKKVAEARVASFDGGDPVVLSDEVTDTNKRCPDDLTVKLSWKKAADLDLYVEDPDMCTIWYGNTLVKSGGVLVEDIIPGTCDSGKYSETIRFGNGVANGGIYNILADYYSDGGCNTGPVDVVVTVSAHGKKAEEYKITLDKPTGGSSPTQVAYVLGYACGDKVRASRGRGRGGKCVCFDVKTVSARGECQALDEVIA